MGLISRVSSRTYRNRLKMAEEAGDAKPKLPSPYECSVLEMTENVLVGMKTAIFCNMPREFMAINNAVVATVAQLFSVDDRWFHIGDPAKGGKSALNVDSSFKESLSNYDQAIRAGKGQFKVKIPVVDWEYDGFPINLLNHLREGCKHWELKNIMDSNIQTIDYNMQPTHKNLADRSMITAYFGDTQSQDAIQNSIAMAERHIEERNTCQVLGRNVNQIGHGIGGVHNRLELNFMVFKPKLVKTEDFEWHGNGAFKPWHNNFHCPPPVFRDQEQMDKFMGRFQSFSDIYLNPKVTP